MTQDEPATPCRDRVPSWVYSTWNELSLRNKVAAAGLGVACIGPLLCFLLWAVGRDGKTALCFSMMFIGIGFIAIWVASTVDEDEEEEDEETTPPETVSDKPPAA